jgi:hypothetical protein
MCDIVSFHEQKLLPKKEMKFLNPSVGYIQVNIFSFEQYLTSLMHVLQHIFMFRFRYKGDSHE